MASATDRVRGIRKVYWAIALSVFLLATLLITSGWRVLPQENGVTEVGTARPGLNGYEFIGKIDQEGINFVGYGYIYAMRGLETSQMFTDPLNPSEATARFTYYATSNLTARAILTDAMRGLFTLNSTGTITFYLQPSPSATFTDPLSFAGGVPIAVASLRYQDMLNVIGPNRGLVVGSGEFIQSSATPFTLSGNSYRFGREQMIQRISTYGDAVRTDAIIPRSSVLLSGNSVDTGQRDTFLPQIRR